MSSRAIRKLQKLHEQKLQQSELDESSEDDTPRPAKPKFNAFDLLNASDDNDNDDDDENEDHQEEEGGDDKEPVVQVESEPEPEPAKPQKAKKKKKKKKSKQSQTTLTEPEKKQQEDSEMDEIDRALKDLGVKGRPSAGGAITKQSYSDQDDKFPKAFDDLLSIQPKFLNPKTEMRKLFGDVALENFDQDAGSGRRRNQPETLDLGQALTGKYCPASRGQCLSAATLRQNPLFQGKGEWPLASSGGLSMEVLASLPSSRTRYRIVHNAGYKDVQRQFAICVESMDPQRMIFHLQHNPYHTSTLLQVSEIAKHQGDHAVAADLLERVLFNIGRSAHSTFGTQLKNGKARLDFSDKANRELWLTGWKYIGDLGMKGTWRTAYEWGKLLLSLNESDPYCISLLVDSLALRGREYAHFVELCTQTKFSRDWNTLLNIQCSLVLAYIRLNKPQESRQQLRRVMSLFPWVFNRLAQELDLQHIPKKIWGSMPPKGSQTLLTELYIARVKDLWNTPEAVALIVEVGDSLADETNPLEPFTSESTIDLDTARHVIMSDYPSVLSNLPREFMLRPLSASDPLPPTEGESEFSHIPRDLLLQEDGRTVHILRARRQLQFYEDDITLTPDSEAEAANEIGNIIINGPLEEFLLGEKLRELRDWVSRFGIDRGNWAGCVTDYWPLFQYLGLLAEVRGDEEELNEGSPLEIIYHRAANGQPSPRTQYLDGPIRSLLGDPATEMLISELELWMLPL